MNPETQKLLEYVQQNEVDEYEIYSRLAGYQKIEKNKKILQKIADDEKKHAALIKTYTKKDISPRMRRVSLYIFLAKTLGLTFSLKLMENGERKAEDVYEILIKEFPEMKQILKDEEEHEMELIDMLSEAKLGYMGSIVLGLNDALVELTGALAGFTFAIQDSRTIALIGIITGISASFSMAASEFLSKRQEEGGELREALISSAYTGVAYIGTVVLLIAPYFLIGNAFYALGVTLFTALVIIALFNFYISVAKDYNFKKRFFEMAAISLGVATISFGIGWFVKVFLGLEI